MALKKPSELFDKKEASGVFEAPEVAHHITESYNKFVDNFETVNEIAEKTKVFEKVDELSEKVEVLSQQLSEKLNKTDLENAMLSQLMVLDENFKSLQNQVKGLNKQDLKEFRETVYNLNELVENIVEIEIPKYKKKITKNELVVGEQINQLQEIVEKNIINIHEEIDTKFNNIAEVFDNDLDYFNQKLEETSSQVKKTTETYTNLSKILENKVSKENEKFEEYSNLIENISQTFEELSISLKEQLFAFSHLTEEKFEEYKKEVNNIQTEYQSLVDICLEDYHKELVEVKADVVINEQHIKNVDKYLQDYHQELVEIKEEVFAEIEKLPVGNLQENLERLEKKIDYIKETYSKIEPEVVVQEIIKEGLLNEPPETKNDDPLTPLNQNFVTLDQLQEHYRLFINRIQQQLSTLGGGGETRLEFLDDVDRDSAKINGRFLKYDAASDKWIGAIGGGGGSQTLDDTLGLGNTSSLGMSVGVVTATSYYGNGSTLSGIVTYVAAGVGVSVSSNTGYVTISASGTPQVNSDWNATTGISSILNKPIIPAAQVNSDWNATTGISSILNKPTIVTYIDANGAARVSGHTGIVTVTGIGLTIGSTPPADPTVYPLWYDNVLGRGFVYYNDGNSSQWVDFSPSAGISTATAATNVAFVTGVTTYYAASVNDDYIGVSANVPVTIDLPVSPVTGKKIIVKDEGNNISTYNITVRAGVGASVENDISVVMNINHQSFTYFYNGSNWFII